MDKPECELIGTDGNVFAIIGKVSRTLKRAGRPEEAKRFVERVQACHSYDEALMVVEEFVEIT